MFAKRLHIAVALTLLTLVGLALRLWGLDAMLPQLPEPDNCYLTQVRLVADGSPAAQVHHEYAKYPHLIARLLHLLPAPTPATSQDELELHLEHAEVPSLRPRLLIACIASLLVPATFLIARRFVTPAWALFAAALSAVSLLHVDFSHQGRPHAAAACLAAWAVIAILRLQRRASWSDYAWAGLACALAIGVLQSGIAVLLPLFAAHLLRRGRDGGQGRWRIVLPLALVAVGIAAFYPFLFNGAQEADSRLTFENGELQQGYHTVLLGDFSGRGFPTVLYTLWSYEPVLVCACVVALVIWLVDRLSRRKTSGAAREELLVVLAYVLPYLLVIGLYLRTYERFVMPLIPYLCCFAAWGLSRIFSQGELGKRARFALPLALAALALPTYACVRLAWLHARPDSTELAARWIEKNTSPEGELMLLTPRLDLPLFRSQRELDLGGVEFYQPWVYPWIHYQLAHGEWTGPRYHMRQMPKFTGTFWSDLYSNPSAALRALGADLALFGTWSDGLETPQGIRILSGLADVATLVVRFAPFTDADGVDRPFWFQETETSQTTFIAAVMRSKFCGPAIAIYRFKRNS